MRFQNKDFREHPCHKDILHATMTIGFLTKHLQLSRCMGFSSNCQRRLQDAWNAAYARATAPRAYKSEQN